MGFTTTGFAHNVAVYARRLGMEALEADRVERMAVAVLRNNLSLDSRSGAVFAVVGTHLHRVSPDLPVREVTLVSRIVAGAYWHYRQQSETNDCTGFIASAVEDLVTLGYRDAGEFASLAQSYCAVLVARRECDVARNTPLPQDSPLAMAILDKIPGRRQVTHGQTSEDDYF